MKAFVSVDMEGMPYIVIPGHLNLKGSLYEEARKVATNITLIVAEELHKDGAETVVVADSHGPMVNIQIEDLPEYVEIIRGYPRPLSMIAGVEDCDVGLFLGYHAKFGTAKSTFDHTYSGSSINKLQINGSEASEFLLNAYAVGEHDVPVILVAGENQLLEDDVKKYAPWAQAVPLKQSLGRISARSPSMERIRKQLQAAVRNAVAAYDQKKTKPLVVRKPVRINVTYLTSLFADVAELLPKAERTSALEVKYAAENIAEAYRAFELLTLAAAGASSLLSNLT